MTQEEIERQSAVLEAVVRDLERAGVSGVKRMDLVRSLLDPAVETQEEKDFRRLQELGNPDYEGEIKPEETLFGQDAELLKAKMGDEFLGRGWSPEDLAARGGEPAAMELSPGSRQADEYRRRRDLIQGVTSPNVAQKMGRFIPDALLSDPKSAPTSLDRYFDDPVKAFDAERNRTYGTSGFVGAMENPEYTFGWYSNNFAEPFTNAIQYSWHEGDDAQGAWDRAQELRRARAAGNRVDPILPGGKTREEKEELFKALRLTPKDMKPKTYDMSFRQAHGYYPSYTTSVATEIGQNFPDALTLFNLGSGLRMGPKLLGRWLAGEGIEEIPPYVGMSAGAHVAAGNSAPPIPAWKDWGASRNIELIKDPEFREEAKAQANKARTDQYIKDKDTGQWRPETGDEFNQSVKNFDKRQYDAGRLWQQMKSSLNQK